MIPLNNDNPYKGLYRLFIVVAFGLNIFAVMGLLSQNKILPALIGTVQVVLFFFAVLLLVKGRKEANEISSMKNGNALIRWAYAENVMEFYFLKEFESVKKRLAVMIVALFFIGSMVGDFGFKGISIEMSTLVSFIIGFCLWITGYFYFRNRYKRGTTAPFEVLIALHALAINNILFRLNTALRRFRKVGLNDKENAILISYRSLGIFGFSEKEVSIPFTSNQKQEAENIVRAFAQR